MKSHGATGHTEVTMKIFQPSFLHLWHTKVAKRNVVMYWVSVKNRQTNHQKKKKTSKQTHVQV